jgi:hypothetical protein
LGSFGSLHEISIVARDARESTRRHNRSAGVVFCDVVKGPTSHREALRAGEKGTAIPTVTAKLDAGPHLEIAIKRSAFHHF